MVRTIPIVGVLFILGATAAMAAPPPPPAPPAPLDQARIREPNGAEAVDLFKNGKHLETVACRDFNVLDETLRPKAIVYAYNYGPKGKPHPTVTIDDVAAVVPVVVDRCKAQPGNHFAATVRTAMKAAGK